MSEPNKQFEVNSDLLGNAGVPLGAGHVNSFRNVLSTSSGDVATAPPPLPPRLDPMASQNFAMGQNYNYGGMGGMAGYGMGGYGGYGMGAGMGSYGMGYGGYGMGGMGMGGGMYGGYNRFGVGGPMYGGDIENRFIQLAEETSRPAFDSIQSLVNAVGSIAMMLENTFFALTSSFRAILGVAENFGRLRSLFAQFWSTFAVIRTLNWIIRKLLVILGLRTENEFKAWAEAVATTQAAPGSTPAQPRASTWPVLMFFGVVAAAPYLVFKMLTGLSNSINEKLNEPSTWQNPLRAIATYDFQATNPQELSFAANQVLTIAPQYLQNQLWNSGWLMASTDRQTSGLVPVNYIKIIKPTAEQNPNENVTEKPEDYMTDMNKMYEQEL